MLKLRTSEGRQSLGRLLAREVSDPRSIERGIIKDLLDPIAAAVTDLLQKTLPNRSAAEIHWAYQMMVGTMTFIMADAGRIRNGLANGANDLPHHRPIFGAQIAGELLLDRYPNIIR